MFEFSAQQRLKALLWLSFFHILIIASSNYLVQLPITIFGFHTTCRRVYLSVYLLDDRPHRSGVWCTAGSAHYSGRHDACTAYLLPAVHLIYEGSWQGYQAIHQINLVVARIAIASFMAYVLGQILDIYVFNRLRQLKALWVAPSVSAVFGNLSDTIAFFSIAFYKSSNAFMAENWVEIALVDYVFKLLICALFFLPMYGILLNVLLKRLVHIQSSPKLSHDAA